MNTACVEEPATFSPIVYPSGQHFSADIAFIKAYGIEEAFLIHHFQHWIRINKKNRTNYIEDRTWTYQTVQSIADHFEFLSYEQVKYAIENLIDQGVIIKENFNKSKIDKTCWYAFVNEKVFVPDIEKSKNVYERENSPSGGIQKMFTKGKIPHREGKIPEPIPDTKPDTKTKQQQEPSAPSASPIAAVSPKKPNSSATHLGKQPKTSIPECLAKLAIPISDMEWICTHFDAPTIEHAVSWVVHPQVHVRQSVVQALKWACREKPQLPVSPEDKITKNKELAERIISNAYIPSHCEAEVLNECVLFYFKGCDAHTGNVVKYSEPAFEQLFIENCRKYKFKKKKVA